MVRGSIVIAIVGSGCLSAKAVTPLYPEARGEQAKCKVAISQSSPLVTEWPASEKANLEALIRSGGVAVQYSGCNMRVLPQCRGRGQYLWQRTTPASDVVEINNEDELYAKLPLGAVSLEGELKRSGKLTVKTYVAGQLRLDGASADEVPNEGECARATHVVAALSIGAFELTRGGSASGKASAEVTEIGNAGAKRTRDESLVRSAGSAEACNESTDEAPNGNCRSPIQVFLVPIPGRSADEGPPGTVKADFVAASANGRWDVYIDDQVACTTPCTRWVDPNRPVLLRAREDSFMMGPDKIQLPNLGEPAGALQLQAHGTARGELLTGITLTSFGGLGLITGITLSAVGCFSDNSDGMCTGGLVSLGIGGLVTAGAIWLILDALPRAEILPGVRASIGPGFVSGTF